MLVCAVVVAGLGVGVDIVTAAAVVEFSAVTPGKNTDGFAAL